MAKDNPRISELIDKLNLKHLNAEAGLFDVIRVSDFEVTSPDGDSPVSNAIYFMLTIDEPQNYLHWLYSDDYQTLIEGGPADYYLFHADGTVAKYTMGRDISQGQKLIVPSPAGSAKAIVLHKDAPYLLVSSVVTPAWSPQRARIGADDAFLEKYQGKAEWATPEFLKFLIGPNYGHQLGADGQGFEITIDEQGQLIWKGMQLTEKQVNIELKMIATHNPDETLHISLDPGAPAEIADRLKSLARQVGILKVVIRKSENGDAD